MKLAFFVAAFFVVACQQSNVIEPSHSPLGIWKSKPAAFDAPWGGQMTVEIVMSVTPDRVTAVSECKTGDRKVASKASSPASVSPTEISIAQDFSEKQTMPLVKKGHSFSCTATLTRGKTKYSVEGDTLTLGEGAEQLVLTRFNNAE